jgi:hypothetical protein
MRGALILLVFFSMFTVASLLIPSPMFPGSFLSALIGGALAVYSQYVSAVFNGVVYGVVLWIVFVALSRRFEQE